MAALELPPWLEAARPADYMARGMGVGAELAGQRAAAERAQQAAAQRAQEFQQEMSAAQAAQQFKMQQAARAEQMQAQEQARADAELHLRASQAADKSKAIMQYQAAVSGGMDPLQAILQFGPAMGGQASPEAAALRASQIHKPEPPVYVPANADTGEPAHYIESAPGGGKRIAFPPRVVNAAPGKLTQQDQAELRALKDEEAKIISLAPLIRQEIASGKPLSKTKQDLADQIRDIDRERAAILPGLSTGTKTASGKRVRVKSPDGKVGSIPEDQLEEALAHGYTKA